MLPVPSLRPDRSRRPCGSGWRRCGPSRSGKPLPPPRLHPGPDPLQNIKPALSISAGAVRLTDGGTRMKYMLLIYLDEQKLGEAERQKCYLESMELARELHSSGKYLGAGPLHPTFTATSVRVREGKRLVTDGPFAETREQLGGYFLVEARDLDEAIGIAE